jgi:hypothetical protein
LYFLPTLQTRFRLPGFFIDICSVILENSLLAKSVIRKSNYCFACESIYLFPDRNSKSLDTLAAKKQPDKGSFNISHSTLQEIHNNAAFGLSDSIVPTVGALRQVVEW